MLVALIDQRYQETAEDYAEIVCTVLALVGACLLLGSVIGLMLGRPDSAGVRSTLLELAWVLAITLPAWWYTRHRARRRRALDQAIARLQRQIQMTQRQSSA